MTPSARIGLAVVALALPACRSVLWEGRTPDRAAAVSVVESDGEQRVAIDGRAHHGFAAVAPETLAFAPDGAVAYGARIARGWTVVVDGRAVLPASARLASVTWSRSPGTLVAVVGDERGDRVVVVRDARSTRPRIEHGPPFDAIAAGSVATTEGGVVAYVGVRDGRSCVVVDHREGPRFDGIARLHLAPDGAPSYLARRDGAAFVVRRGAVSEPLEDVADLVADPSGAPVVALVRDADGWHADDGVSRSPAHPAIGDLQVKARRVAYRVVGADSEVIVVDGVERGRWPKVEELALGDRGAIAVVARDGGMRVVVVDGQLRGAFEWAGDLRWSRRGLVFAARERGDDLVIDGAHRHVVHGLVRGSLQLASDGVTWGALTHGPRGLRLTTRDGGEVELDVAELIDEARRRESGSPATALEAWTRAEIERVARRTGAP